LDLRKLTNAASVSGALTRTKSAPLTLSAFVMRKSSVLLENT